MIVAVAAVLLASPIRSWGDWRAAAGPWALRLAPLLVVALLYLGLRATLVGLVPPADPSGLSEHAAYAPVSCRPT